MSVVQEYGYPVEDKTRYVCTEKQAEKEIQEEKSWLK